MKLNLINNCHFAFRKMRLMVPSLHTMENVPLYKQFLYIAFSHFKLWFQYFFFSHNFESSIVYFLDCWLQNNKVKLPIWKFFVIIYSSCYKPHVKATFFIAKSYYLSSGKLSHANFNFGFGQKQNYTENIRNIPQNHRLKQ